MGYNPLNVSAGRGDTRTGPMWYCEEEVTEKISLSELFTDPKWIRAGEGSTDGVESSQSATVTAKRVWGSKNLGNTVSEFSDTLVANFASSFDSDVLGIVFGSDNVQVGTDEVLTVVKSRTPPFGTFVFQMELDDGRAHWIVVPAGQPDPNLTRTFNDADIVVTTTTIMCAERTITVTDAETDEVTSFVATHYELTEPLAA